jgi:hypothetical protein
MLLIFSLTPSGGWHEHEWEDRHDGDDVHGVFDQHMLLGVWRIPIQAQAGNLNSTKLLN